MAALAWAVGAGGGRKRGSAEPDNKQGGEGPEAEVRGSKLRLQGVGWAGSVEEHRESPTPRSAAQGEQGYDAASQAPTVPAQCCSHPGSAQNLVLASMRLHPQRLWTWKGSSLIPLNAAYKSQQASGCGALGQGHPARGQDRIPQPPPAPPALEGGSGKSW